jgi:uncharacterized protein YkwD
MRFVLSFLLLFGTACPGLRAQTHDTAPGTIGDDFRAGVEKRTFLLVNQYRTSRDLPALIWADSIAEVAREHSRDMATGAVDFGHDGFRDRVNRLSKVMAGFAGGAENVLMTSELDSLAERAVDLWLMSPHHLKNIRGDYNYSGLGVWQDKDGVVYFTQIFMKFSPDTEQAHAEPAPEIVTPFGMLATPNTRARP